MEDNIGGVRRRLGWTLLAAWVTLLAGLGLYADGWRADNRIERWAAQLTPDPGYGILRERFGGDEVVLVRIDQFDPESAQELAAARLAASQLTGLPGVTARIDPFELCGGRPWNGPADESVSQRIGRAVTRALALVGEAPPYVDVLLQVDPDASPATRAELSKVLLDMEQGTEAAGLRARSAGHPLVSSALDTASRRVERTFTPLLVLVAVLGCALFLRSVPLAVLALLPAGTASLGVRAVGRALLGPSDLILVAAGPIAFVVQLAAALHLIARFQVHLGNGRTCPEASRLALSEKWRASLLAAVTTAVGFAVFRTSPLRSVSDLGSLLAGVSLVGCVFSLGLLPVLLAHLPLRAGSQATRRPRTWRRVAAAAARRGKWVVALSCTCLVLGALAAPRLSTSTNGVEYFPRGHRVRQAFLELEAEGAALSNAELLLARSDGAVWTPGDFDGSELSRALSDLVDVRQVFGPGVILDCAEGLEARLLMPAALVRTQRLSPEGHWARWSVRFATGESDETQDLIERIQQTAERLHPGATVHVAGSVPRLHAMQSALVGTMARSLCLTFLATGLLLLLVTRRPIELGAALLANSLPVAVVLIGAWLANVPLDGATTMVAAVVLGLAVDNTFHLLHAAGNAHNLRGRLAAFGYVGDGAAIGAAALALGFATLAFSGFAPTARFGALAALGSASAWLGDLLLLPAVWLRRSNR